jgi:hypothetical protein
MNTVIPARLVVLMMLTLASVYSAHAQGVLWQLGTPDGTGNEFALAPKHFSQYGHDGFHYVGTSHPDRDWPYAHPGPLDRWAGGGRHPFFDPLCARRGSRRGRLHT